MTKKMKIIRKPLRWKKVGLVAAELRHGSAVVGEVFRHKQRWHFKCFDGRNTSLTNERGWRLIGAAMAYCKAHIKGASYACQLPGICPTCGK